MNEFVSIDKAFIIPYYNQEDIAEVERELSDTTVESSYVNAPFFERGKYYALITNGCDGFKAERSIYELIMTLDFIKDIPMDSVVMKQVDGKEGKVFSLTKDDCEFLGIPFEEKLLLFPKKLGWKKGYPKGTKLPPQNHKDDIPLVETRYSGNFHLNRLMAGNYPYNVRDRKIHTIYVRISNVSYCGNDKNAIIGFGDTQAIIMDYEKEGNIRFFCLLGVIKDPSYSKYENCVIDAKMVRMKSDTTGKNLYFRLTLPKPVYPEAFGEYNFSDIFYAAGIGLKMHDK
jgi:hypothetical protein